MIRFLGYIWRFIERLVKAIQVIFFLVVVGFIVIVVSGRSGAVLTVPDSAALILAPAGIFVDQQEGEPLDMALLSMQGVSQEQTVVRDVVESLRRAAEDERIEAVVLLPGYLEGGGLSKQQVVGAALNEFKASGKPVIAMADSYGQTQYYLAAYADEIYMHDFGFVLIEGFGYFRTYFADAIDKLNVDVNVFRVGEYKSFVEPYTRNSMSLEDRQASRRWVEGLWDAYRIDISEARGLSIAELDAYINDVVGVLQAADGDAARAAIDAGLVDGLKNHHEFRAYMIDMVGRDPDVPDSYSHIDYYSYLLATDFEEGNVNTADRNVAVIVASGNIVDGEAAPGTIGSLTLSQLIRDAANDDSIAAVVLQVDSPGGSMFGSEVVLDQLQALQARGKPLVASMSSLAASGGYYISMSADEIWASETTISGSIGVGAVFPTFQRSLEALGINIDGFGMSPFAGQLSPVRELGDDARQLMEVSVKSAYDLFIGKVAEARQLDLAKVDELARGRVWIGTDALELGLVDQLGTLDDAIESAAALAGLPEDSWGIVYVEKELSIGEQLLLQYARLLQKMFSYSDPGSASGLLRIFGSLPAELELLKEWNDPRGIFYHCMCELR